MRFSMTFVLLFLFFICNAMVVPLSNTPVQSDDNLLSGMLRVTPDDKAAESLETKTWLWQDGNDLMLHIEAEIDSTFTKGSIRVRDDAGRADYLRVQLITMPDAYFSYLFAAYPLGTLEDGVRGPDMSIDFAWDSHYSYQSEFSGSTWKVTMRIPLGELRFKQPAPYNWKIILHRNHESSDDFYALPYCNTKSGKDYYLKATDIMLTQAVKHKLDIKLKPYYVKSYDLISRSSSWDPEHVGLDIAFNPGQRTRIKMSVNPDYSDTPMDSAQDDYNNKYPPYYSENRFFFTEDIDVFGVDADIFNSRNIAQPRLAFKATGSSDVLKWGVLGAFDKEIRDGEDLINRNDYYQVLALSPSWRKFQMTNAVVSRINKDYYNHAYSGAADWELIPNIHLASGLSLSTLEDKEAGITEPLTGYKAELGLSAAPGDFEFTLGYTRLSQDLAFEAGYLYEMDQESWGSSASWSKTYAKRKLRYLGIDTGFRYFHEDMSEDPYYTYYPWMSANLTLSSRMIFFLNAQLTQERDQSYNLHQVYNGMINCTWFKLKALRLLGNYAYGRQFVYILDETHTMQRFGLTTMVAPLEDLSFNISGVWMLYGYPQDNVVGGMHFQLDNNYLIANAKLEYTPRSTFKISLGSGLSTYERRAVSATLSYYGNLRYEFKPEYFLYLGLKSAQTQDVGSDWNEPLGHFRKDLSTIYAKVSITI